MVNKKVSKPKKWTGLNPAAFREYRTWKNTENPGICGTYVSGALLHYLFKEEFDEKLEKETVIEGLRFPVDGALPYKGTFPWDLKRGLDVALKKIPGWKTKIGMIPDLAVVNELSKRNPLPIAVGTTSVLGSPYKNHWLLVYAFGYNDDGKLFFKAYDNHGRHAAIVPASQTFGFVKLVRKEERKRV